MKAKIKTVSFWTGLIGAILMIVDAISGFFGIDSISNTLSDILFSLCTILIVAGVINKKSPEDNKSYTTEELIEEMNDKSIDE